MPVTLIMDDMSGLFVHFDMLAVHAVYVSVLNPVSENIMLCGLQAFFQVILYVNVPLECLYA